MARQRCLGIYALTGAIEGFFETGLPAPLWQVYVVLGVAPLWPLTWPWHALTAVAVLAILAWNVLRSVVR